MPTQVVTLQSGLKEQRILHVEPDIKTIEAKVRSGLSKEYAAVRLEKEQVEAIKANSLKHIEFLNDRIIDLEGQIANEIESNKMLEIEIETLRGQKDLMLQEILVLNKSLKDIGEMNINLESDLKQKCSLLESEVLQLQNSLGVASKRADEFGSEVLSLQETIKILLSTIDDKQRQFNELKSSLTFKQNDYLQSKQAFIDLDLKYKELLGDYNLNVTSLKSDYDKLKLDYLTITEQNKKLHEVSRENKTIKASFVDFEIKKQEADLLIKNLLSELEKYKQASAVAAHLRPVLAKTIG